MQIKGTDAPDSARIGANRATVGQLTPHKEADQATVSLALSRTGRVVAEALARVLPEAGGLRVGQLLTPADHAMLALASELVEASGLPPEQLRRLVNDLAAYRLLARTSARTGTSPRRDGAVATALVRQPASNPLAPRRGAAPSPTGAREGFLTLRAFGGRDEALARDILRSPAVRGGVIDRGFVTALLDPDVSPAPSVDLSFLRQLAGALTLEPATAAKAQPQAAVSSMIARRDARGFLARALSALALPTEGIVDVTPDRTVHGDTLLRARMPSLLDRLGAWLGSRTPSSATQAAPSASPQEETRTGAWLAAVGEPVPSPAPKTRGTPALQAGISEQTAPHPAVPQTTPVRDERVPLTRDDRALLRLLYSAAAERGTDLRGVDDVAAALVAFRRAELADASRAEAHTSGVDHAREDAVMPRASVSQRPAAPRTYGAPRSLPPGPLSQAPAPHDPQRPATPDGTGASTVAHDNPSQARSYGSTTQMAARLANSYGRLAPTVGEPLPAATADYVAREAATRAVALLRAPDVALPYAATLPLDLGHALGLGALFSEVQRITARTRRQRRRKKRQQLMRAIGALAHSAATGHEGGHDQAPSPGARRARTRARKR